jgi:hypothetical protein
MTPLDLLKRKTLHVKQAIDPVLNGLGRSHSDSHAHSLVDMPFNKHHHPESLFRHWNSTFYPTTNADANNDLLPRQLSLSHIYDDFPVSSCSKHSRSARQDVDSEPSYVPTGQR